MDLIPKLPPGRANRKALAHTTEIHRLRSAGYSFEAIRLVLREAGLEVSRTTLKREAAKRPFIAPVVRRTAQPSPPQPTLAPAIHPTLEEPDTTSPAPGSYVGDSRSGKEIVEAFMQGRITNPLMQERIPHESRSD
ncbi:MAG: hypothetical protein ABI633_09630 [Burkholderiales bacterium]